MFGLMVHARQKVLLLAADEFEDMELLYPRYRLAKEDVQVTAAGLDDQPVRGKTGAGQEGPTVRCRWTPRWTG
jgi:putative intracellular protease/amidase